MSPGEPEAGEPASAEHGLSEGSLSVADIKREIDAEIQLHIDEITTGLVEDGWSVSAALPEARRRFGDTREIARDCLKHRIGDRIMQQRITLALTATLAVASAGLFMRGQAMGAEAQALAEAHELKFAKLDEAVRGLQVQNAELREAAATKDVQPGESLQAFVVKGSKVETVFKDWFAGKPNARARVVELGDEAVAPLVGVLTGEIVFAAERAGTMRFVAANLLGDGGSREAVQPLIASLADEYFNVRRCAALALGKLGDQAAIEPLEELAANDPYVYRGDAKKGPQALVRVDAQAALAMLK